LDRRLHAIEDFLIGRRVAWYNTKLEGEYLEHLKVIRNDVIEAFVSRLADHGKRSNRSKLSRQDYAASKDLGWPSHDQHLLAAALEGTRSTIFVTEKLLATCKRGVKRKFQINVERL
jgi:hypothetical protein